MRIRIALALSILAAVQSNAIIMRHDRDASRYRSLALKYPAAGILGGRVGCVLIAPRWALSAAHTIEGYFNPVGNPYVVFGKHRIDVDKIIIHPRRIRDAVDSDWDLVLLRLKEPVTDIAPLPLYDRSDEIDQTMTLVGPGENGVGSTTKNRTRPGVLYAARNKVEAIFEHSMLTTFTPPPGGDDLEGVGGPGDSGNPAILERDGKPYLAGIGSWGNGEDGGPVYNALEGYSRISSHREWIEKTIADDPPSTIPMFGDYFEGPAPATPAGKAVVALVDAFNRGTIDAIAGFYEEFGRKRTREQNEQTAAKWVPLIEQYGRYDIVGFREAPNAVVAFVHASKTNQYRGVAVIVGPDDGYRVKSITMADVDALPKH